MTPDTARTIRDINLKNTDWYMLSDSPDKTGVIEYRQALRDVPQQEGFPDNIVWPTLP
jgi:hypothetical protein